MTNCMSPHLIATQIIADLCKHASSSSHKASVASDVTAVRNYGHITKIHSESIFDGDNGRRADPRVSPLYRRDEDERVRDYMAILIDRCSVLLSCLRRYSEWFGLCVCVWLCVLYRIKCGIYADLGHKLGRCEIKCPRNLLAVWVFFVSDVDEEYSLD